MNTNIYKVIQMLANAATLKVSAASSQRSFSSLKKI